MTSNEKWIVKNEKLIRITKLWIKRKSFNPTRESFPYRGGIHSFLPDQIIRLEADSNYTYIFSNNHRPILMAKVLGDYQILFEPFGFILTHNSHLVNKQHISGADSNEDIIMDDKSKAGVSRRKRRKVLGSIVSCELPIVYCLLISALCPITFVLL